MWIRRPVQSTCWIWRELAVNGKKAAAIRKNTKEADVAAIDSSKEVGERDREGGC